MPDPPTTPGAADDPWLTVKQISEELKLHPATVRAWVKSGRLAAVRAGRTWRVRRSAVEAALMSDASSGYTRQARPLGRSATGSGGEPYRTEAPRGVADHIISIRRRPEEQR